MAVVAADQEAGVSPLHVEICIQSDAEVLVRHLGDVLDVNTDRHKCWTYIFVILKFSAADDPSVSQSRRWPLRAFSWLKASTSAFTFRKLGRRHKGHYKEQAGWLA